MRDDPTTLLRVPPHSSEAEQAVLGAVLTDNAAYEAVADLIGAQSFYSQQHRAIWSTVEAMVVAGKPADILTVHAAAGHEMAYLNAMCQSIASTRNARAYAHIVQEQWRRRELIRIAGEVAEEAYREGKAVAPVGDVVDRAVVALLALQARSGEREPKVIAALLPPFLDAIERRAAGENDAIATGLRDIDRLLSGGFRRGELIVIGARPSMGKSALSLTIARYMAAAGVVLVCSMEDSEHMLVARQVAAAGRVNLADIRSPERAPDAMWAGLADGVDALTALRLHIDDSPALSLRDVRRKIAQTKRRAGDLHVVVVDYLQLMQGPGNNRHEVLGAIAAGLKAAAKEYGVAVVLLSQLNREADKTDGPPRLDHLRESGGIEEAADIVGLLWREHRRKPRPDNKHTAQIEFAKHKNGPTDTVRLWFDGATQRFCDWQGEAAYAN